MRTLTNEIERKFGVRYEYKTDKEMFKELKKAGVPSLVKLLKLIKK